MTTAEPEVERALIAGNAEGWEYCDARGYHPVLGGHRCDRRRGHDVPHRCRCGAEWRAVQEAEQ